MFTAVRCPECGHEGRGPEFKSGCPVCGYAAMLGEDILGERPAAPAPLRKGRGMPVVFSRIALLVLSALFVALVLILVLRG
jgi:hypothetical protein